MQRERGAAQRGAADGGELGLVGAAVARHLDLVAVDHHARVRHLERFGEIRQLAFRHRANWFVRLDFPLAFLSECVC